MEQRPERKFWVWALLLAIGLFILVGAQAALFFLNHGGELSVLSPNLQINLLIFLGVALGSLLPFLIWGMGFFFNRYVIPLHRFGEDLEALLHGSPAARLVTGDEDPAGLNRLLNDLMERFHHSEEVVSQRLERAVGDLTEEKSRLEWLLDALLEGVVVFSIEGDIARYNQAARFYFAGSTDLAVGKPIAGLIDPPVLQFAREQLMDQLGMGVPHPFVTFFCRNAGDGDGLLARISPLLVLGGRLEGYVLTVEPEGGAVASPEVFDVYDGSRNARTNPDSEDWSGRDLGTLRYVVLDTETTGLDPAGGDEVISIGAVVVLNGKVMVDERFDHLVKTARAISPSASKVHGITEMDLQGAPTLEEVMPEFLGFARDSVLVAHNAAFDMAFLHKVAASLHISLGQPVLDTMLLSAALHPGQPSHSLDTLLTRYGITEEGRHTALGDALMTAELLVRLLPQLERRGIRTLGEAQAASRRTPLSRLSYG